MKWGKAPFCLVLSGGGAKGVYHIGAWRALRELGIPVGAFIGNSIGAIIACFLAQGADKDLEEIGRTITVDTIVNIPDGFKHEGMLKAYPSDIASVRALLKEIGERGGLDTSPLRAELERRLDEELIRASGKDLGIVAVNLSDLVGREIFLDEMEPGSLVDYVMASSAFPGFQQPVIKGKRYLDGGLYDNLPYRTARKRGYKRIIVVDISGMGVNQKPDVSGSVTVYIKNSIDMGGILDFDRRFLDAFNLLGYLDTMRVFGRYKGYSYFIVPDEKIERRFRAYAPVADASAVQPRFPESMRHDRDLLLKYLECAASILGVERILAYSYRELAETVDAYRLAADLRLAAAEKAEAGESEARRIEAFIRDGLDRRSFDETPYFLHRRIASALSGRTASFLIKALSALHPSLEPGLRYLDRYSAFWKR